MMRYEIHPFFCPTTIALVDDNFNFLNNLGLQLDARHAFRLFQSPIDAEAAINGCTAQPPSIKNFFSAYREREDNDESRHVIDISLSMIHREVHNPRRFEQLGVVVVDYDMPEINGVEFCRRLHNPLIKKILLTGKADERVAVEAFNDGLIDRFIRKQDEDAIVALNQAIADMQHIYFEQLEKMLSDALSVGSPRFLQDRKFAERFQHIRAELGIVEYYLTCLPDGMLMLDEIGTPYLLIVRNQENLRAIHEIAYDQAAPEELLSALRSGRVLPYFWQHNDNYSPACENWWEYLHPATEFAGEDCYLYSLIKNPGGFNFKHLVCYGEYLEQLDKK